MHSSRIQKKVKDDYNLIGDDFSKTRKSLWPDFNFFSKYFSKNFSVLDLGCGNGRLLDFLEDFEFSNYLGVDNSNKLLKCARELHPANDFRHMDIIELHGLDSKFDCIFSIASFHHVPPSLQIETLLRWKSLLNNGGYLFMTNWNLHQRRYLHLLLKSLLLPKFGRRGVLVPWHDIVERYYYSFTLKRLKKLLSDTGFTPILNEYVCDGKKSTLFSGKNILTIAKLEK